MIRIAVVVLAAASLVPGPATAESAPVLPEMTYLIRTYGISARDAAGRLARQAEIGRLGETAAATWPATFGGLWIDQVHGGTVHLAFTRAAVTNVAALAARFSRPDLLRAVTVARSHAELRTLQARVHGTSEIDLVHNTVVVTPEGQARNLACSMTDCRNTLRSGLKTTDWSGFCSTAFSTNLGSGVLTAGHCTGIGEPTDHAGETIGTTAMSVNGGLVDAASISTSGGYYAGPYVYVGTGDPARLITSTRTWAATNVGDTICKSGARTGTTCGTISSKDFNVGIRVKFIKSDMCAQPGDSGAGVYTGDAAVGIMSAAATDLSGVLPCTDPEYWSATGHIEFAQAVLGVAVTTVDSPPVLTGIEGTTNGATAITVRYTEPVSCDTVEAGDFDLETVPGALHHTITGVDCAHDSDGTITVSFTPALQPLTTVRLSMNGFQADPGNQAVAPLSTTAVVTV